MKQKIEQKRTKIVDFTAAAFEMEEFLRGNYIDSFASLKEVQVSSFFFLLSSFFHSHVSRYSQSEQNPTKKRKLQRKPKKTRLPNQ